MWYTMAAKSVTNRGSDSGPDYPGLPDATPPRREDERVGSFEMDGRGPAPKGR